MNQKRGPGMQIQRETGAKYSIISRNAFERAENNAGREIHPLNFKLLRMT